MKFRHTKKTVPYFWAILYEHDIDILKMYLYIKNELTKVRALQTDRQSYRHTQRCN